ncbi:MAG: PAS domain-containing protein, partial [Gammaproteobacteria bacterium]|nr:PAS domain-containing protein [Gammaproteobacteria bacterium]
MASLGEEATRSTSSVARFARRSAGPGSDEVLQGLTTAVVVLGRDLRVVFLNPAAETLLGTSQRQAIGKPL